VSSIRSRNQDRRLKPRPRPQPGEPGIISAPPTRRRAAPRPVRPVGESGSHLEFRLGTPYAWACRSVRPNSARFRMGRRRPEGARLRPRRVGCAYRRTHNDRNGPKVRCNPRIPRKPRSGSRRDRSQPDRRSCGARLGLKLRLGRLIEPIDGQGAGDAPPMRSGSQTAAGQG
jgi:hypothetical protein